MYDLWRDVASFRKEFNELKGTTERDLSRVKTDLGQTGRSLMSACFSYLSSTRNSESLEKVRPNERRNVWIFCGFVVLFCFQVKSERERIDFESKIREKTREVTDLKERWEEKPRRRKTFFFCFSAFVSETKFCRKRSKKFVVNWRRKQKRWKLWCEPKNARWVEAKIKSVSRRCALVKQKILWSRSSRIFGVGRLGNGRKTRERNDFLIDFDRRSNRLEKKQKFKTKRERRKVFF